MSDCKVDPSTIVVAFKNYLKVTIRFIHDEELLAELKKELTLNLLVTKRERGRLNYAYEPQYLYVVKRLAKETVITTGVGFMDRVTEVAKRHGRHVAVRDSKKMSASSALAFVPDSKFLAKLKLREEQKSIIELVRDNDTAQFCAATGAGKTFLIKALCRYYPKARFLITTYSLKLLKDIYNSLADTPGLNVSMRSGSTRASTPTRIQLCSMDSIHSTYDEEYDFLIIDERQEACTKKRMTALLAVKAKRCYGFSANEKDRTDNADKFVEAVAGPFRYRATYESSVDAKSVAPIKVVWRKYHATPIDDLSGTSPNFDRLVYWTNYDRNMEIVNAIQEYVADGQVLVYVNRVEHIYNIRKLYKCPVVHAVQSPDKWEQWKNMGLVEKGAIQPTPDSIELLADSFRKGKVPVIICNSVWKRGVDFPNLRTVILAHGGSAPEEVIQAAGRVSRIADGKEFGRLVDLIDKHNHSANERSKARHRIYKKQGWEVISKEKP